MTTETTIKPNPAPSADVVKEAEELADHIMTLGYKFYEFGSTDAAAFAISDLTKALKSTAHRARKGALEEAAQYFEKPETRSMLGDKDQVKIHQSNCDFYAKQIRALQSRGGNE